MKRIFKLLLCLLLVVGLTALFKSNVFAINVAPNNEQFSQLS